MCQLSMAYMEGVCWSVLARCRAVACAGASAPWPSVDLAACVIFEWLSVMQQLWSPVWPLRGMSARAQNMEPRSRKAAKACQGASARLPPLLVPRACTPRRRR
jgi:hypothetical protein